MMPKLDWKKLAGVGMAIGTGLFALVNALSEQKDAEKLNELWEEHKKNKEKDEEAH